MSKESKWTEELVKELEELYLKNCMSISEIANHLGFTKNAVIGKLHRIKSKNQDIYAISLNKEAKGGMFDSINFAVCVEKKIKVVQKQGQYKLSQIEHNMCVWPFGDDYFTFCGATSTYGKVYCQKHLDMVYLVTKKVKKKIADDSTDDVEVEEEEEDVEDIVLEKVEDTQEALK